MPRRSRGEIRASGVGESTMGAVGTLGRRTLVWRHGNAASGTRRSGVAALTAMTTDNAWLSQLTGTNVVRATEYAGDRRKLGWLPNEAIAKAWMQYVKDTNVADTTPPPAPTKVRLKGNEVTWDAEADLESGLACFNIEHDGKVLTELPHNGKKPYNRPVFQNPQYSNTPTPS